MTRMLRHLLAGATLCFAGSAALELRTKWSESKKPLNDPAKYYDGSFHREALAR